MLKLRRHAATHSRHLLAHVYTTQPYAPNQLNRIAGHGFSTDGLHWNLTAGVEPYSYNVTYSDGTSALVATRERPIIVFDPKTNEPAYLFTAVLAFHFSFYLSRSQYAYILRRQRTLPIHQFADVCSDTIRRVRFSDGLPFGSCIPIPRHPLECRRACQSPATLPDAAHHSGHAHRARMGGLASIAKCKALSIRMCLQWFNHSG